MSELALGDAAGWTAAALPESLIQVLHDKLPGFEIDGRAGAAQFIATLAQEIQLIGEVSPPLYGVHAHDPEKTAATIFFAAMDPFLAEMSLAIAVQLISVLARGSTAPDQLSRAFGQSVERVTISALDQSTKAMIVEAERRDIPWFRMSAMTRHVQFGQGHRQRRIFETLRSAESPIGRELSRSKLLTFQVLSQIRLPVGRFSAISSMESALAAAETIGYPIVLKPVYGKKGERVFANLLNAEELRAVLSRVGPASQFLLQSFFPGDDHRILIVDGKLVAATRRNAAGVTGDGKSTIAQLVEEANRDPRRGGGFSKLMTFIVLDEEADRVLQRQSHSRDSVPAAGERVRLRSISNISSGGTAHDVTDIIHPDNVRVAAKAAKALELTVAGVDFISPDISKSWHEVGGGICEVNSVVGLRPHLLAKPEMNVVGPLIETIYPGRQNGRIPTAMITGTKGKSTTTKMLGGILACAGHTVGAVTTDGVTVGGEEVAIGDYAGATGATIVLRDPTVTAAVLETARGGLIKSGMYLDWCDVAALTNVAREQIEIDGINTIEQMAALKRKVLDAAKNAVVLNSDDEFCAAMAPEFAQRLRTILFSLNARSPGVRAHLANGGEAVVLNGTTIEVKKLSQSVPLLDITEMPSTMNGVIQANVANGMAAAALALGLGISMEHIREALRRYDNSLENAGCRFSFVNGFPLKIMFDRAAQAPAFSEVMPVLKTIPASGKRICLVSMAGNRPDWGYSEGAEAVAGNFDHYVCYERSAYRRGKKPGEIANNFAQALSKAGVAPANISIAETTEDAALALVQMAAPEDLAVVFCADAHGFVEKFREAFAR
ncbi:MAG: Mur ligase family protein, partial [Burkholderiales bacterium]